MEANKEHLVLVVQKLLTVQNKKITAAESLTAGSFLQTISSVPGASDFLEGGIVTYSNRIKTKVLGVSQKIIDQYGVVSPHCAIEMAEKSLALFDADISVSLTGVAGPSSLEGQQPGTVWIGLAQKGKKAFAKKFHFDDQREENRKHSVLAALNLVYFVLSKKPVDQQFFKEINKD